MRNTALNVYCISFNVVLNILYQYKRHFFRGLYTFEVSNTGVGNAAPAGASAPFVWLKCARGSKIFSSYMEIWNIFFAHKFYIWTRFFFAHTFFFAPTFLFHSPVITFNIVIPPLLVNTLSTPGLRLLFF